MDISKNLLEKIKPILNSTFSDNINKRKIRISSDSLNFACPYCFDSDINNNKKRGNLYIDSLYYHCYNCDIHKDLESFLKDFDIEMDLYDNSEIIDIIEKSKNQKIKKKYSNLLIDTSEYNYLYNRNELKNKYSLKEIEDNENIKKYLNDRLQFDYSKFLYSEKYNNLFILNTINDDKFISFQIRNFDNYIKYKTYTYNTIKKIFKLSINNCNITKEFNDKIEKISLLYNLCNVDFNKNIYVFEGPLDSLLMDNSIALCTVNNNIPSLSNNKSYKYIMDYDTSGIKKSIKLLNENKYVFLWSKFLKDYNIKRNVKKIDWTDIMLLFYNNNIKIKNLNKYFSNDQFDGLYI